MSIRSFEVSSLSKGPITVDANAGVMIPGVKFKTHFTFAKLGSGPTFKIQYTLERWHWFNEHCFGGVMKPPKEIEITRNTDEIETFGSYTGGGRRRLRMHPKLWELPNEKQALGTLLHEMAHQYETEHRPRSREEILKGGEDLGAHGPTWQGIMAELGMPVDATYKGKREDLQTDKERRVVRQYTHEYSNKAKLSDLQKDLNYLIHVNLVKGRAEPVVIIGKRAKDLGPRWGIAAPGFSAKDIRSGDWHWFPLARLFVPDKPQMEDFSSDLFSERAHNLADKIRWQLAETDLKD